MDEISVKHGPKPAEEWAMGERWDALDQLGGSNYIPIWPKTVAEWERVVDREQRYIWLWTGEESIRAIVRAWPGDGDG